MIRIRVVLVVDTSTAQDLRNNTSSRFKVPLPDWERLPVQVMPDDHSNSVPPLPIPNRTVKRDYADDSAATSVKVGYRQASYREKTPQKCGVFFRLEIWQATDQLKDKWDHFFAHRTVGAVALPHGVVQRSLFEIDTTNVDE